MKTLKVTWKGTKTLIMHSCQCVNQLNPIQKEMKKYTSKRTKTEEDLQRISDLEWEAGAYWKEGMGLYIPGENVTATIVNGARLFKKGTDIQKYVKEHARPTAFSGCYLYYPRIYRADSYGAWL